mmetsp:Transcript_32772/g.40258  ORF Transcript_32772/g.40258 Transcript_32772/m.40258 type:complete len:125 (-) Transcript_32772:702-1076(-)
MKVNQWAFGKHYFMLLRQASKKKIVFLYACCDPQESSSCYSTTTPGPLSSSHCEISFPSVLVLSYFNYLIFSFCFNEIDFHCKLLLNGAPFMPHDTESLPTKTIETTTTSINTNKTIMKVGADF